MEVQGKIKLIKDTEEFGTFKKREWVITTDEEKYPQEIMLECHQDKCNLLDSFKAGQNVKASINLRGKMWTNPEGVDKYFNSIVSWRIEASEVANASTPPAPFKPATDIKEEEHDDLPF